jgi:PAS domain S-box-containing protein
MPANLRDTVEGLRAILWQADAQTWDFHWVSHHAEEILGYPVAQWLNEPGFWAKHIHPEDRDHAVNTCMLATARGEDHQFEYRAIASDGRIVWLEDIVRVVRDEEGRPSELWGVMVDITERKRAEEGLHLLVEVTAAASGAQTMAAVASACIEKVCEFQRWECGQAWFPSASGDTLVCIPQAFYSNSDVAPFRAASLETPLLKGLGLPGCVWQAGTALWWADATQEPNFPQRSAAAQAGLRAAFAFPVKLNGEVLAVFEFLSKEVRQPDGPLLGLIEKLGAHLGEALERRRSEDALNEDESRLRALFDQLPAAIWTTDRELRMISLKGAPSRIGGLASLIGKKPSEVTPRHEVSEQAHLQAIKGTPVTYERPFQGRALQCHVEPLMDRAGNITGVIGIALDITESKKAQQALEENETRWQLLCEKSGTAILTVDVATRILSANPAAQHLFGYTEQELKQLTVLQMTHEDDRKRTRWIVREMVAGRKSAHRYEKRYRRKDGRTVWVSTTGTLVRDALGAPWFFTLMLEDITQRKRAEATLARLSERMRRMQDEERRKLAHELHDNTAQSLAALSLNLGVVETAADQLSPPIQGALRDAIALASQSAREIRTFAYLLHPPELEELGLASALTAYAEGFRQRSGIRVELDIPRKISPLPRELELGLFRIVQESLSNIQRHSRSKTARIRVMQRRKELLVEVKDRGRGFAPATARSNSVTSGVGISGMKERARQLGGSLEVVFRKTGTTVKVILPLPRGKAEERA